MGMTKGVVLLVPDELRTLLLPTRASWNDFTLAANVKTNTYVHIRVIEYTNCS